MAEFYSARGWEIPPLPWTNLSPPFSLEQKTDIRVIQVLLGHKKLTTTARYAHVATHTLSEVQSPLDRLTLPAP